MMSYHSRSSSEIETISFRDVLPIFLRDFLKDFCFDDVKDSVKHCFTEEQLRLIVAETDEKKQILQLFWILYENEQSLEHFLRAIQPWYPWLSRKIYNERDCNLSKDGQKYLYAVRALRSDFQKHLDVNVHRMEYYWSIRAALKKLTPFNYVVVSGELGAGKKWLAVDVCSEYSIMKTMGFKIFWLDVHQCTSREEDFRALEQFRLLIGEGDSTDKWRSSSEFDGVDNKILHIQQYIKDRLVDSEYKDCLLILSDVQNSKTLRAFNLGCKILIITRNRRIADSLSKKTTTHISIEKGLTTSECFQLFEKVLRRDRNTFHKDATDIFIQSRGQPYLLSIIANNLKLNKRNWSEWIKNLQETTISHDKFKKVVEISLLVLQSSERELYKRLTIFPHSTKIPLKLIAAVWDKSEHETRGIVGKFDKYSIIVRKYLLDGSVAVVLPYIYSSYLKTDKEIDRVSLHRIVVSHYDIDDAFKNRTEVDLFSLSNDNYSYHCIGYHLSQSKDLDLLSKLFLDFGFLGEKLRSDGFANTIGDLKYYRDEVTNGNAYKRELMAELLKFIPTIEEMLFLSKDTVLLQYALMAEGVVKEEAEKQASQFNDKIWFIEKGHFHQRRQMVCLPSQPKLIKLPEADTCVIVLENNDILLADISLDYNNGPVYLTGNKFAIANVNLFFHDNYIITLDVEGHLKVWSITDDRRRSANRKRNSRTKVNPLNLTQSSEMLKRKHKQIIQKSERGAVTAFFVERCDHGAIDLHLAFVSGDIGIYSWNPQREEFEIKGIPMVMTKVPKIIYLSKILDKYYLLLSNSGKLYIYNLRDGSQTAYSFEWPQPQNFISCQEYKNNVIYFMCRDRVFRLKFEQPKFEFLKGDLDLLYLTTDNESAKITCARLSPDGCYLVMGTERGLIVFDTKLKSEVLRGNVSECIACVDIFPLDDNVYKYVIVCGSKQSKILNLFALRQTENNKIAWSHRQSNSAGAKSNGNTDDPQFEPDVWLQGKKLFDFNYSDSVLLVAADSKNRIHQLCTTDTKNWSISLPPETSRKITAISSYKNTSFCAYDNGEIFNITNEVFEPSTFTDKSITFLQMINENTLVASSKPSKKTLIRRMDDDGKRTERIFDIIVFKCFTLFDSYLILVDEKQGFGVVNLNNDLELLIYVDDLPKLNPPAHLGGCDFKNNYLLMATTNFKIIVYKFSNFKGKLGINYEERANSDKCKGTEEVTCVTSSSDATLFAVGLKTGTIEIYQMDQKSIKFIYRLLSHTSKIYDLKFSPNTEVLVSCSEQLCFWNVAYVINNPFDTGTKRKRGSTRFSSSNSPVEEITNALAELSQSENDFILSNPWSGKRGPADKPELLSCIKFVGNKAEIFYANDDFTQFNTIDNEGVYYHLCIHDISRKFNINVANGNGHSVDAGQDDEVIT